MKNPLNQEQKEKLLSSVSKNWEVYQKTEWLIDKIDEFSSTKENKKWKERLKFLTDEKLEEIQNPQEGSVFQKVVQNFLDNDNISTLSEFINYEKEVREVKITSHQSINNVKGNAKMKNFSPQSYSDDNNPRAEFFQSISNVGNDLTIDDGFSPISSNKESVFSTKQTQKTEESSNNPILGKQIGQGAQGQVYKGTWQGKTVAVKKIPTTNAKEITREIKALERLNNRNIIEYYGDYSQDNHIFLIMEFAEQGALTNFIKDNQDNFHNWKLNYNFINQITVGLNYLHENKIIHRDLKSGNILITQNNILKLADFGLVKFLDSSNISISGNQLKGTARWLAPEVLKGDKHSFESDIYSLGMVIWEIVAKNTIPFKQFDNDFQVIWNVGKDNLKEIIPTDTPQKLQEIINKCWEKEPEQRISLIEIENKINQSQLQLQINKEQELNSLISSLKAKLKSKSNFANNYKKREEQLINLFDNLPNTSEEFINQLETIKTDLSKRLTQKEIKELIELNNECSLQSQVLQQV